MRLVHAVVIAALSALAGCVSAQEQHAADQQRCYGYGFQLGTNAFAHCMMSTDQQRTVQEEAQKDRDAGMLDLSRQRNGNSVFPVCTASMPNVSLDTANNAWYGPNCRER